MGMQHRKHPHPQICVVEGCSEIVRCKNYCELHYNRWIRSGRIAVGPSKPLFGKARGKTCCRPNCGRPVRCINLCTIHYDHARKTDACPKCGKEKGKKHGLCSTCYLERFDASLTEKKCWRCQEILPVTEFCWRRDGRGKTKLRSRCRKCSCEEAIEQRNKKKAFLGEEEFKRRKEIHRKASEKRVQSDPLRWFYRSIRLSAKMLKLNIAEVVAHVERVGNVCEACGWTEVFVYGGKRIHLDHDHATGKFRGLLCDRCNRAAGIVYDNSAALRGLAAYLEKDLQSSEELG